LQSLLGLFSTERPNTTVIPIAEQLIEDVAINARLEQLELSLCIFLIFFDSVQVLDELLVVVLVLLDRYRLRLGSVLDIFVFFLLWLNGLELGDGQRAIFGDLDRLVDWAFSGLNWLERCSSPLDNSLADTIAFLMGSLAICIIRSALRSVTVNHRPNRFKLSLLLRDHFVVFLQVGNS
jgi:hypothetical protein